MKTASREALTPRTCVLARERLGWSQYQLATASGITLATVINLETGLHKPRYKTVTALLRAFSASRILFTMEDGDRPSLSSIEHQPAGSRDATVARS